ncbi:MAG: hypothetical protein KatS3mg115_2514 [Candidatus Poribacteria bacterium]|nr:MAG: hypothetical protein KatS3mg115_2514 [Candidatus Poribacteria bacterium]
MAHLEAINRAKIVCTLGPASNTEERIVELIRAGMDVVRLNFSHGTYEEHREVIRRVRKVAEELGVPIPIIQDLSGPKLRTGSLQEAPVFLEPGARFVLTAREVPGNRHEVSVNYPELIEDLLPGDRLLLADGALELRVKEKTDSDLICEVIVGGELGEHKGINVPDRMLRVPSLTDKDRQDLAFGLQEGVDWVALSFVRTADDVLELKRLISRAPREVPVIAKIEKRAALDNLETILLVADGVMVARGDLGVEIPMPDVPWAPKGDHSQSEPGRSSGHHRHSDAGVDDSQPPSDASGADRRGQRDSGRNRRSHALRRDGGGKISRRSGADYAADRRRGHSAPALQRADATAQRSGQQRDSRRDQSDRLRAGHLPERSLYHLLHSVRQDGGQRG